MEPKAESRIGAPSPDFIAFAVKRKQAQEADLKRWSKSENALLRSIATEILEVAAVEEQKNQ